MTAFEQFIAQEYGRKQGDSVDDIYDEARARWRQMQSMPVDDNARAAQGMFASLPEPEPVSQATIGAVPAPDQNYSGRLDLLTPANKTMFDDLPDSSGLRQEQTREMEIAQRQSSGVSEAAQPQGLPPELVQTAWRMFADDYRDFSVRTDGPMKSEMRQNLVDEYTRGFAENYAPVLGVTLAEAQAIAEKAALEKRGIQPTDWMMGQDTATQAPALDVKQINDVVNAAKGLTELGRDKEAQQLLVKAGVAEPENDLNVALNLVDESAQLQAASRTGRWTSPDGQVYERDQINAMLAENQNKLAGLAPRLAAVPSKEGTVLNMNEFYRGYIKKDADGKEVVNISGINKDVSKLAEKYPGLLVISQSGNLLPASGFKYEMPTAAPSEGGEEASMMGLEGRGYDASGRGAAKLAKDVVRGSVEGLRKANNLAASALYQSTKDVGSSLFVPGTATPISGSWFKDFTDELTGSEDDEDSK
jgi:hypothetical protein